MELPEAIKRIQMTVRGGARMGAGRPQGGISQTRRLISSAITKGLAHAGRLKYPEQVSSTDLEEAAADTAAMIVSDMIQAGQGNDVIKIWAQVSIKESDSNSGHSKNILADALSRLPSASHGADMTQTAEPELETFIDKGLEGNRPTDTKSRGATKQPFFAPQALFDFEPEPDLTEATHCAQPSASELNQQAASRRSRATGGHPPPPAQLLTFIPTHEKF